MATSCPSEGRRSQSASAISSDVSKPLFSQQICKASTRRKQERRAINRQLTTCCHVVVQPALRYRPLSSVWTEFARSCPIRSTDTNKQRREHNNPSFFHIKILRKAFPTDSLYPEENRVNLFRQVSWLSLLLQPSRPKYLQQWQGVAEAHPSNDGLRITVAGTAPAFNRIPFSCTT